MATKRTLIEKLKAGGQIAVEDLQSLGQKKNKDPDVRPATVCSPKTALAKAKKGIILNRWELEELAKSPEHAFEYAKLKNVRFPECEEQLLEKGGRRMIVEYFIDRAMTCGSTAVGIVQEPNESFERWLLKSGQDLINRYCSEVRGSRWEEGEEALFKVMHRWGGGMEPSHALAYQKEFGIGPWDALERILLNGKVKVEDRSAAVKEYLKNCGPGRHEVTERRLLKFGNASAILLYARHCVCGRLPDELHNKMVLSGKKSAKKYLAWLVSRKRSVLNYLASIGKDQRREIMGMFPEDSGRTG